MTGCKKTKPCAENESSLKEIVDKVWPKAKKDFENMAVKTRKEIEEIAHKLWPRTKKELESALENTKEILSKGEQYLKDVSDKGIKNTKKLSLNFKREKLYYDLGKTLSKIAKDKWLEDQKADVLLKKIKILDQEIKEIK